jgi:Cu(I)/Ag(I) efflux system membrane fusion protein
MDHTAMNHEAMPAMNDGEMAEMNHEAMPMEAMPTTVVPEGLKAALDAYLAIQRSLASDELTGVVKQAQAFDAAVGTLSATPLESDPHFWHSHAADLAAIRTNAKALADASDIAEARVAFGRLSAPFVGIVEVTGVPEGYDVERFTCGMVEGVPEGGVWLQRSGDTRNPYYGSAMLTCGARDHAMPMMDHSQMDHDGRP